MSRRELPRFAGLRDGDLIRVARRVTVIDLLDGAAFCLLAVVVVFAVLAL